MQGNEEWQQWKWILGLFGSMMSGAAVGGWVGRGMVESVKQQVAALRQKVLVIEAEQHKCQSVLKDDIKEIVQQAIDRQAIARAEQMGEIRTELAVITALHAETQKDVKALFCRLDRRKHEIILPQSGERRDQV
jgi:hypothetical protein